MFTWSLLVFIVAFGTVVATVNAGPHNSTSKGNSSSSDDEFPTDIFNKEQRRHGAIIFHFLVLVYCFLIVSYVCQDYFLPSIFCICQDLEITPDVAAATFMASGTSFPEMSVNVISTFITKSDLGIGTIVGGSVCNSLGVAAIAGLATRRGMQAQKFFCSFYTHILHCAKRTESVVMNKKEREKELAPLLVENQHPSHMVNEKEDISRVVQWIKLEKWSLLRDSITHLCMLTVLTAIVWDGVVIWSEALILVILYFVYFAVMLSHKRILAYINNRGSLACLLCCINTYKYRIDDQKIVTVCELTEDKWKKEQTVDNEVQNSTKSEPNLEGDEKSVGTLMKVWSWITLPIQTALSYTIPDCKKSHSVYPISFIMSVVWIGTCSYLVCWMVTVIGDTFGIPDVVMGMLFLAIGGSVPEGTSSFINSRNDRGSMSLSNTLGANTLDILLSLGVPWFVKCLIPTSWGGGPVRLTTSDLPFNCAGLIFSVVLLNIISASTGYRMNHIFGICCLISYLGVSTLFILVGMDVVTVFGVQSSITS